MRQFLLSDDSTSIPTLTVPTVRKHIIKAKKPTGIVPGDLPKRVVQICVDELAVPATMIFNKILMSAIYPEKWKIEHQVPIPKIFPPESVDDLRNIAKTSFLSKVFESFLADWILHFIRQYLDPNQCGVKGSSITHYLIKLLHFVQETLDEKKPLSKLITALLSKTYMT